MKTKSTLLTLSSIILLILVASKSHAQTTETYTADPGDGVSHIAKRAGFTDYASEARWNLIANWNGYSSYQEYHLFVGDQVKVIKDGEPIQKPAPKVGIQAPQGSSFSTDIESTINTAANKYGVRASLLRSLLRHESGLRANAVSPTGDYGIAQINLKSHPDISVNQAFDPYFSIMWAAANLSDKIRRLGEFNALRAYNCGEAGIKNPNCGVSYANRILNDL